MSQNRPRISLIVGSTRPVRIGRQLTDATAAVFADTVDADIQVLDLAEINLPLLDEPLMASMNQYSQEHTVAWAKQISESDAVVFVTPQYNAGYPAALKNAIDYLYAEWKGRPAAIISSGAHGGGAAAKQLREVLEFIGLDLVPDHGAFTIERTDYTPEWGLVDADAVVARYLPEVQKIAGELMQKIAADEDEQAA